MSESSAVLATLTLVFASVYLYALYWLGRKYPRAPATSSGIQFQRHGPAAYAFMVLNCLIEFAISCWLVIQYDANHNYPNSRTLNSVRFLLFCVCWTAPAAALHSIFLLHPVWSQHRVSSIGSHSLWIFLTWIFWVAGAAALNDALPLLFVLGVCGGSVNYCTQLRALFAFAVINILILTFGMLVVLWHAWKTIRARYTTQPA